MSTAETEVRPNCLKIGVVAYEFVPNDLVFVRIPNEPGRWVLTKACVAKVACPHCGAIAGEPCFNHNRSDYKGRRYTAGHHFRRANAARHMKDKAKVRVTLGDLAEAREEIQ